ncbi:MAG: dinitrogenase iron-molybdenum cofactor biosynthesis protein [candidate division WS1 bacterium]|jgi:predicted Fe-Mo cluster-binding NifX family protein|nr:dinitrogenase iron-molybdenum cofactor biosynthesis protein [candidate division WS1 bacterium]
MKIAVTGAEADLWAPVDQRFGRARFLLVVDLETNALHVHDNEINLNATQGAGIQTAQNVARLEVQAVLTGHLGPNAHRVLKAAGIEIFTGLEGSCAEALEAFRTGKLAAADSADVEGHWI